MKQIFIRAADGYELSALYTTPVGAACGSIILSSATGIKKEFYIHFSKFLVQNGYTVLLYDYRGVGGSVPDELHSSDVYMHDWGILDMNAVLNYMVYERGLTDIIWFGHSIGAQLTGFLRNTQHVKKVIAVNAAVGYWGYFPFPQRLIIWALCYLVNPVLLMKYGYHLVRKAGWVGKLPKNVLLEWRQWCKTRHYYRGYLTANFKMDKFYNFRVPVTAVYTSDDYIANDKNALSMLSFFPNAPSRVVKLQVDKYSTQKAGHTGIFSKKFHRDLWAELIEIIEG